MRHVVASSLELPSKSLYLWASVARDGTQLFDRKHFARRSLLFRRGRTLAWR